MWTWESMISISLTRVIARTYQCVRTALWSVRVFPIDREEDDFYPTDEVLERHVADSTVFWPNTTVSRIVATVSHHEIMPGGDLIDRSIVVEAVADQVESDVADAVRQRLAPLFRARGPGAVRLDEIRDALLLHWLSVDVEHAADHLDGVAGQSDDPVHIVGRRVSRQAEHDKVAKPWP